MDFSVDANLAGLPVPIIQGQLVERNRPEDTADRTYDAASDPVEALCRYQRRYEEAEADRRDVLYDIIDAAYLLGLQLEQDQGALLRLIQQPLFRERPRPPQPHHRHKPLLLAVQFVFSARTPNEQKRASCIARALRGFVGDNPEPGAIRDVLRMHGLDNLARAQARARQKTEGRDSAVMTMEAADEAGQALEALLEGQRAWVLVERMPAKRGRPHFDVIQAKAADPDG